MRRRSVRHRGYVLLMTLLVLAIAAAATASVCRMSLAKALRAGRAEEGLQQRWGALSCRTVLLPRAEQALATSPSPAAVEVRRDLRLGRVEFTLVFGDEQAKANVNEIFRRGGRAEAERAARELVAAAGASARIDLSPRPGATAADGNNTADQEPAFASLAQLFGDTPPAELLARRGSGDSLSALVTVWGDGLLNVRRARPAAMQQACRPHLNAAQVQKLLAARDAKPADEFDLDEELERAKVSQSRRDALDDRLDVDSTCHSLWVISRGAAGRTWYDLTVSGPEGDESDVVTFRW